MGSVRLKTGRWKVLWSVFFLSFQIANRRFLSWFRVQTATTIFLNVLRKHKKFLAEKLSLIPNTKLVISNHWHLSDEDHVKMFQDTLHLRINGRGALSTMLEVLNKRWQTLDLISVFREIKRTLPVPYELFYQGDRSTFDYYGCQIVDILTCLPKLQKVDP